MTAEELLEKYKQDYWQLTGMSKEAFDVLIEYAKEYHKKQLQLNVVVGSALINDLLKESEEVISINGLRFSGTHEEKIKQVFDKHGIKYESPF